MVNLRRAVVAASVIGSVWFGGVAARAAALTVPNYSFESPDVSTTILGTNQIGTPNTTTIPDWSIDGPFPARAGLTENSFLATSGVGFSNVDQQQFAYIDTRTVGDPAYLQLTDPTSSLPTIQGGASYTVTVGVGRELAYQYAGTVEIDLLANGTVAASQLVNASALAQGTFQDFSATLASNLSSNFAGQQLSVRFVGTYTDTGMPGGKNEVALDNVRLTTTAVTPEPASLGLLGLGAIALLRKRRTSR